MSERFLDHWPQQDPLIRLRNLCWRVLPQAEQLKFGVAYGAYQRKFHHVRIVCGNIDSLVLRAKKLLTDYGTETVKSEEAIPAILSEIELGAENLIIHLRILMDRVAQLSQFFYQETREVQFSSFSKHRKFFLKDEGRKVDEEYADFIKRKTDWFTVLKNARDDLVVHFPKASLIALGGTLQIFFIGTVRNKREILKLLRRQEVSQEYNRLAREYPALKSEPPFLPDGTPMHLAIEALESAKWLSEQEAQTVRQARQEGGGPIPNFEALLDSVSSYLNFVAEHFERRFKGVKHEN